MCKIITVSDFKNRTDQELHVLFQIISKKLAACEPGSETQRNMLASLENIKNAISLRRAQKLKPPGC